MNQRTRILCDITDAARHLDAMRVSLANAKGHLDERFGDGAKATGVAIKRILDSEDREGNSVLDEIEASIDAVIKLAGRMD